jgi:hypothetical protein
VKINLLAYRGLQENTAQDAQKGGQQEKAVSGFVWSVSFVWLNETNQINQINQINKTNQHSFCAACQRRNSMSLLIRKYKSVSGMMQEERIDDPDRIERYMRLFEKDDIKKLETGVKVFIEKDEWQLLP